MRNSRPSCGASPAAAPVAPHGLGDADGSERLPERCGLAGHDGLAEVTLQTIHDAGRRQPGAADEERRRRRNVGARGRAHTPAPPSPRRCSTTPSRRWCAITSKPAASQYARPAALITSGYGVASASTPHAEMRERGQDRAGGGERAGAAPARPVGSRKADSFAKAGEVAHRRVRQRDHIGLHRREGSRRGGERIQVAERSLLHPVSRARVPGQRLEPAKWIVTDGGAIR